MALSSEFDTYRIYYHSAPQYSWQSRVYLYDGSTYVGRIMFIKDGKSIPANTAPGDKPVLNLPSSSFDEIMDIFRHEKPLYITLNTANGIGTISTSNEPIGEEEN